MKAFRALSLLAVLAGCQSQSNTERRGAVDQGYLLGVSDTVKQLYWAKQALESPDRNHAAGRLEYYQWEDSGTTPDGRKLAPETVAVPVFVPDPVPPKSSLK